MDTVLSITTTVGSADTAQQLARKLIQRRLAACVQIDPAVSSHYQWQGQDCMDEEWRLTIKTAPSRRRAIEAFMVEAHPYELPQLLWQDMQSTAAYAAWVRAQLDEAGPAARDS